MPKPYMPSNGTEGDIFMGKWCASCALDCYGKDVEDEDLTCPIIGNAMAGIQPDEWVEDENGPRCTAFRLDDAAPPFDPAAAVGLLL